MLTVNQGAEDPDLLMQESNIMCDFKYDDSASLHIATCGLPAPTETFVPLALSNESLSDWDFIPICLLFVFPLRSSTNAVAVCASVG